MFECVYADIVDLKNDFEFTIKADNFNDLLIILDKFNRSSYDVINITFGWSLFSDHPYNSLILALEDYGFEVSKK